MADGRAQAVNERDMQAMRAKYGDLVDAQDGIVAPPTVKIIGKAAASDCGPNAKEMKGAEEPTVEMDG